MSAKLYTIGYDPSTHVHEVKNLQVPVTTCQNLLQSVYTLNPHVGNVVFTMQLLSSADHTPSYTS